MKLDKSKFVLVIAVVASIGLAGCVSSQGGKDYSRSESRGESAVRMGTVVDINLVNLDGTRTGVGAAAGTIIGGIAGQGNRDGYKGDLAGAFGAIIGGLIGQAVEQAGTRKKGIEIIIDLGGENLTSVVQEDDGTKFNKGDRVRLTSVGGNTRVVPLN